MLETTGTLRYDQPTPWIPVSRAAAELRVTRSRVYQLIEQGLIVGRKLDRTWFVSHRSVKARVELLRSEGV